MMVSKRHALCIVFILLFACPGFRATAQPTLPDIAGSADKGIVVLSWDCQYSGIKSITVMRSSDSVKDYSNVGNVKILDKGLQAFVDGHPAVGKNYYKLTIVFRSGLTWHSNRCSVTIDKSLLESSKVLIPSNDSLQHFTVTEEKTSSPTKDVVTNNNRPAPRNNNTTENPGQPQNVGTKPDEGKRKIAVSFDQDIPQPEIITAPKKDTVKPALLHHKIVITFDDQEASMSLLIKSRFFAADPVTGHVNMELPDDVNHHNYAVKFYDQKDHMILEIPRIKAAKIIIDRRNFQHKGVYKFVLRKDGIELETGYVSLN